MVKPDAHLEVAPHVLPEGGVEARPIERLANALLLLAGGEID
jgi:hypothetical protein